MSNRMVLQTVSEFENVVSPFIRGGYIDRAFVANLKALISTKLIESVEFPCVSPERCIWDGEMLIHFKKKVPVGIAVNSILAPARADEFSLINGDWTMRLWWD